MMDGNFLDGSGDYRRYLAGLNADMTVTRPTASTAGSEPTPVFESVMCDVGPWWTLSGDLTGDQP